MRKLISGLPNMSKKTRTIRKQREFVRFHKLHMTTVCMRNCSKATQTEFMYYYARPSISW